MGHWRRASRSGLTIAQQDRRRGESLKKPNGKDAKLYDRRVPVPPEVSADRAARALQKPGPLGEPPVGRRALDGLSPEQRERLCG